MPASAVVGAFDPGDDRESELLAGGPAVPVQDVLLEQGEELFLGGVVGGRGDLARRSGQMVVTKCGQTFLGRNCDPRSVWTTQPATWPRRATAMLSASTAIRDFIWSLIE